MSASHWTFRQEGPHRWTPEEGWSDSDKAERAARFYRRDRRRPCVVIPCTLPDDYDRIRIAKDERGHWQGWLAP